MNWQSSCLVAIILSLVAFLSPNNLYAAFLEWSDITPQEGRYSKIYFDYDGTTFHVINDWIANQDGLRADEFNRFNFTIGTTPYEIRIFSDPLLTTITGGTLLNFQSATGWATSPNLNVNHAIWEFQFDVLPQTIYKFTGCDPASATIVSSPPPVTGITTGPSRFGHVPDGVFTSFSLSDSIPIPSRSYLDPVPDPWFPADGFVLTMFPSGGIHSEPIPEPGSFLLLGLGGVALIVFRRRIG